MSKRLFTEVKQGGYFKTWIVDYVSAIIVSVVALKLTLVEQTLFWHCSKYFPLNRKKKLTSKSLE